MIPNENTSTTDKNKNIPNTVNNNVKNKNILDVSLLANNNNNLINTVTTTSDITDAIKQQKGKKQVMNEILIQHLRSSNNLSLQPTTETPPIPHSTKGF